MLLQDIPIPVYFSKFNPELDSIIEDISNIKANATTEEVLNKRDSALSEIINQVSANGYQVSCSPPVDLLVNFVCDVICDSFSGCR